MLGAAIKASSEGDRRAGRELRAAVIAAPNPRAAAGVAKALELDPKTQLQDTLWTLLGDTGAAQPLLLLAAALERAKPGDSILLVGYGDGADALAAPRHRRARRYGRRQRASSQIERKRLLPSYGKYARFRKLIRKESRRRRRVDAGGRCSATAARCCRSTAAAARSAAPCSSPRIASASSAAIATASPSTSSRAAARLFTFTNDYMHRLARHADHPRRRRPRRRRPRLRAAHRLRPRAVEVDMPVELTFRKYHEGSGMQNYFWKARPRRCGADAWQMLIAERRT